MEGLSDVALSLVEKSLKKRGKLTIRASGGSMLPLIRPGQEVWVERCRPSHVRVGSLVLFRANKIMVIHRVHQIKKNGSRWEFVTKGDANEHYDLPISARSVLGIVRPIHKSGLERYRWQGLNQVIYFSQVVLPQAYFGILKSPRFKLAISLKRKWIGKAIPAERLVLKVVMLPQRIIALGLAARKSVKI